MKIERFRVGWVAALVLVLVAGAASAQERHDHRDERNARHGPQMQLDSRYQHNRYYPRHGDVAPALPHGSYRVPYRGGHYFFQGGAWYRPSGAGFVVVAPPFGIVLPFLPPVYATLRFGGVPYYYADGTYYAQAPGGYAVVPPPPGADAAPPEPPAPLIQAAPPVAPAPPEPIFYPRNGQSAAQTEVDRRACNRWATTQPSAIADATVFQRAVEACMDGRGYTGR